MDAMEVYHDRSECPIGQLIIADYNQVISQGGPRHCAECDKYGAL